MPKDSADDILELTDIVEEGALPDAAAAEVPAEAREPSFEDELDALFGDVDSDLDEAADEEGAPVGPPVDPDEKLDMPDMSDLDSLLDDLGGEETSAEAANDAAHVDGVDELLADILPEAPAAVEEVVAEAMPDLEPEAASMEAPADEFDALLAEMDAGDSAPAAPKTPAEPAPAVADPAPAAPAPAADTADIDAMFAELDMAAPAPADAPAEADLAAPPAPAPEAAPEAPPAPEAAPAADPEIEQLDALIDDIMSPASTGGAPAAAAAPDLPAAPAVEEDQLVAEAPAPPAPLASEVAAESTGHDLEALAQQLAEGPLLAAIHTMVVEEVSSQLAGGDNAALDAKFAELEERLTARINESVDKAAAAAAARIIREEISALLQEL